MYARNLRLLNVHFITFLLLVSLFPAISQDELDMKIAQMVMVSFAPDTDFEDTLYYDIEHRNLGGVILFGYNLQDPGQISNLTASLQNSASTPLFIATDQEGGIVARLDENNGFLETQTAYQLGTVIDNEDSTRNQAKMMAQWLYDSGINTNLAPVVDVNVNPASPAIGYYGRSFSSDPIKVFTHARWFISEFDYYDIISTLKHFPGHGSAEQDSHLGFTDVTTTWADSELVPYRNLILSGYSDMIMIGHLYNANLDPEYPASLSEKVITNLLRDSLGYKGVVASDAMFMRAITDNYSFEEAIILAINAGTDLLLYTKNEYNGASLLAEVIKIVRQNIDQGVISQQKIEKSYQRIMALKTKITSLAVRTGISIPETFSLRIYPNPFNITTTIEININRAGPAEMEIYDIQGRRLYAYRYPWLPSGRHIITYHAVNLASGIYFLKFESSGTAQIRKLTLIK